MTLISDREFFDNVLRRDLTTFIGAAFNILNPTTAYLSNWHIRAIAYHLELVRRGDVKRLIIAMPPRSLKSISASVAFAAWIHAHNPSAHIIASSYGQELAIKHHNDYRKIVESDLFRRLFPRTRFDTRKNAEHEILLTGTGTRLATSVGGPITGRGADYIILDDVQKPQDAFSEARRLFVQEWYGSTILSRLNNKVTGAIIVVGQRLHEDDLIGYLLDRDPGIWTVLTLPAIAIAEEQIAVGDGIFHTRAAESVLHSEREPRDVLDQIAREIGAQPFAAQYQQCPIPFGGHLFERRWFQRYETVPDRDLNDRIIQSWDTASKLGNANDYSVCTTWLFTGKWRYLLDVYRDRVSYTDLRTKAIELARAYKVHAVLVEDAGVGAGLIDELNVSGIPAIAIKATENKLSRAEVQTRMFEAGNVRFPRKAPWLNVLEAELLAFPGGRHDDQVDSIVQALAYVPPRATLRSIRF